MATFEFLNNEHLTNDYENTIDFDSLNSQTAFWGARVKTSISVAITTSRLLVEDEPIKINLSLLNLLNVNYCRIYQDNKYWYFFITSKKFINDNNTALNLELDVMQTFMFDYEIKESFVEREHQDRWTAQNKPIFNIKQESIKYGEDYKTNANVIRVRKTPITPYPNNSNRDLVFVYILAKSPLVATGNRMDDGFLPVPYYVYLGIFIDRAGANSSGTEYTDELIKWKELNREVNFSSLRNTLSESLLSNPDISQIIISKIPPIDINATLDEDSHKIVVSPTYAGTMEWSEKSINGHSFLEISLRNPTDNRFISIEEYHNNYAPVNLSINSPKNIANEPKLLTFPYNYRKVLYGGNEMLIKNEHCEGSKVIIYQAVSGECYSALFIKGYLEDSTDINPQTVLTNQLANNIDIINDAWRNYLLTNKAQRQAGLISTALSAGITATVGVATGGLGVVGAGRAIGSGVESIASLLAKEKDIKNTPDDITQFSGDVGLNLALNKFLPYEIKFEILDEEKNHLFNFFFKMGYLCQEFKIPDIKSRYYFNFIKTVNADIDSDIDNVYISRIAQNYNKGITFWHYRDESTWLGVNNYEKENVEMSLI